MKKHTKKDNRCVDVHFRATVGEDKDIRERAKSRKLTLTDYLVGLGCGNGLALGWVAELELQAMRNLAESLREIGLINLELAVDVDDEAAARAIIQAGVREIEIADVLDAMIDHLRASFPARPKKQKNGGSDAN